MAAELEGEPRKKKGRTAKVSVLEICEDKRMYIHTSKNMRREHD